MTAPAYVVHAFGFLDGLNYKLRFMEDKWIAWHPLLNCYEIQASGTLVRTHRYSSCKKLVDNTRPKDPCSGGKQ